MYIIKYDDDPESTWRSADREPGSPNIFTWPSQEAHDFLTSLNLFTRSCARMGQSWSVILKELSTLDKWTFRLVVSQAGEAMIYKDGDPCGKSQS